MQFLFGPLLGTLSDRFGRKPVLMVSIAALGIDYVVLATAPHLWVLFVGRLIAGIAGATFSTAFAVAADVSTPEEKGANIGLVSAGFGLGFVLGPALGGVIGEAFGPRGRSGRRRVFLAEPHFWSVVLPRKSPDRCSSSF